MGGHWTKCRSHMESDKSKDCVATCLYYRNADEYCGSYNASIPFNLHENTMWALLTMQNSYP